MKKIISRREFMQQSGLALAGVAAAGCGRQTAQEPNIFDALGHYEFTGQDGKPVNIGALRTSLKDSFVTACFGFNGCGTYCTFIDPNLSRIGDMSTKKLTSIIIDVQPQMDSLSQHMRDAYMRELKTTYKIKQNIVILYPSRNGMPSQEAATNASDLARDMGMIGTGTKAINHSAEIGLYGPGGNLIAKKNGLTPPGSGDFGEWKTFLAPQTPERAH
jgi:hypothetical protein